MAESISAPFTLRVRAAGALQDFATRSRAPGVVRAFSFDDPAHYGQGPNGFGYGYNWGWYPGADNNDRPVWDTTQSASGLPGGSLKFTMSQTQGGGLWVTNFSRDLQTRFRDGEEFFCQWRQRFDPTWLQLNPVTNTYGGWKQAIIATADTGYTAGQVAGACTCNQVVIQNLESHVSLGGSIPFVYTRCPDCGGVINLFGSGPSNRLYQNARPAPYCQRSDPSYFPPGGNCFGYFPNEWMTFQVGIKLGNARSDGDGRGGPNGTLHDCRFRLWGSRQGRAQELIVDIVSNMTFPLADPGFGKFWMSPRYDRNRNYVMTAWYDEVIISRSFIADAL